MTELLPKNDLLLEYLTVLFLDCQTTGASPQRGGILELGWAQSTHSLQGALHPKSFVMKRPEKEKISGRVLSMTGIQQEEIESGHSERKIWMKLIKTAKGVAKINGMQQCPAVIHYAKFEKSFLEDLHHQYTSKQTFPFHIICTHEIARRMFPHLPRKGIRAIAGYLGHSIHENRRCLDHVMATAFIWGKIVQAFRERYDILSLKQLQSFITSEITPFSSGRSYPMDAEHRLDLPQGPGVYRMLRSNGDVLYVGKATSLRQRVNSYFQKGHGHAEHILEMLSQAKQLDVTRVGSALEAAVLESDEIKRLSPPYNKSLRKRGRRIVFFNHRLDDSAETPDDQYRIGPFVSQEPMKRMAALYRVLTADRLDAEALSEALGVPDEYGPDEDCLKTGFEMFNNQYRSDFLHGQYRMALIDLGRAFWLRRLAEKQMKEEAATESDEEAEKVEFMWTPEAVARTLERNVLWGTHEQRRARWFVILSESCLTWEENGNEPDRHLIVLEKGHIVHRETFEGETDIPVPPGHGEPFSEKQRHFDLATWDRMRVLSTEMRKIVHAERWIRLRLGPSMVLDHSRLGKLFKWI